MGSRRDCTWILGLSGLGVERIEGEEGGATSRRRRVGIEWRGRRRYPCSGCGRWTSRLRSARRRECLDHIIVVSEAHLRRVLALCVFYYQRE